MLPSAGNFYFGVIGHGEHPLAHVIDHMLAVDKVRFVDADKTVTAEYFVVVFEGAGSEQLFLIGKKELGVIAFRFEADDFGGLEKESATGGTL